MLSPKVSYYMKMLPNMVMEPNWPYLEINIKGGSHLNKIVPILNLIQYIYLSNTYYVTKL